MKRGVMGGTFDPIHRGHVQLARHARRALDLDRVEFVPCHRPPHKERPGMTDARRRLEMVEIACRNEEGLVASSREVDRGGVSYTVVTLREMRDESPGDELFFLVGADSLAEFGTWAEPEEITRIARLVVLDRPGHPLRYPRFLIGRVVPAAEASGAPGEVWTLEMPPVDLSSTAVRERAARGESLAGLVPAGVAEYIEQSGLYREGSR